MSELKVDRVVGRTLDLPQVDGIGSVEAFITTAGQTTFTLANITRDSQIVVYVDGSLATWSWVNDNTISISAPGYATGSTVRVYKVLGELAYKNVSNIVGTVSEAAGVPTGAIIESGSNANGQFIRWADGTQICTNSNNPIVTDPAPFVGTVVSIDNNKLRIGRWF